MTAGMTGGSLADGPKKVRTYERDEDRLNEDGPISSFHNSKIKRKG
jgi:hypothetical protein